MIILTALRFLQDVVVNAAKLRRAMLKRYPDLRDES